MAKLPEGIERAKFDRDMEEWVFQDKLPFWSGFVRDAGKLGPPKSEAERRREAAALRERAEAGAAKMAAAMERLMEQMGAGAKKMAASDEERRRVQAGMDMMVRLMGEEEDDAPAAAGPAREGWFEVALLEGSKKGVHPAQRAAYEEYVKNHEAIGRAVLEAVFKHYRKERPRYVGVMGDEAMPEISKPEDLRYLMEHLGVLVHAPDRKGRCDIGLTFGCEWEEEHGLGVLVRGGKVVEVGDMDVA